MAKLPTDLTNVNPEDNSFKPLPAGDYDLLVETAELKANRNKNGFYINLKMKVINNPTYEKRIIWDIVNVKNENAKAQEIGLARLKRMLEIHNLPVDGSADTDQLVGKVFKCYLKIEKNLERGDTNKVASYSPSDFKTVIAQQKVNLGGWV